MVQRCSRVCSWRSKSQVGGRNCAVELETQSGYCLKEHGLPMEFKSRVGRDGFGGVGIPMETPKPHVTRHARMLITNGILSRNILKRTFEGH
jgi:hypothetical protein